MGSNNLRGSNIMRELDLDNDSQKKSFTRSPDINKSLPKDDAKQNLFDEVDIANIKDGKPQTVKMVSQSAAQPNFKDARNEDDIEDETVKHAK